MLGTLKNTARGTVALCAVSLLLGLGVSAKDIARAVEHTALEKMRERHTMGDHPNAHFVRRGQVGDWRNWLERETAKKLDRTIERALDSDGPPTSRSDSDKSGRA